jgi:hypothetical protein
MTSPAARDLIGCITRCPEVLAVWNNPDGQHPCRDVVRSQDAVGPGASFQVPEPWAGHIDRAPLLFMSSNPSISRLEPYPEWDAEWDADRTAQFFIERFGPGPTQAKNGVYYALKEPGRGNSQHSARPVPFWNICKRNAEWLYDRRVTPGADYAMTEVVHCKSRSEVGVSAARDHCMYQWFDRILQISSAAVIVVLGGHARYGVQAITKTALEYWTPVRADLGGRSRLVMLAQHPNSRQPRRWDQQISPDNRSDLRDALTVHAPG